MTSPYRVLILEQNSAGFDQKDGMKACEAVGMKMETIPFYLQASKVGYGKPDTVAVPKYDMRGGTPECPCVNESPTLTPFRAPANDKAKNCPFEFGATGSDECVPWLLSQVEGVPDLVERFDIEPFSDFSTK